MTSTSNLSLPFLEAGQAQKHVTHNEALRMLDAAIHLSVSAISATPPVSPAEGERHIVAASATGAFAAHDDEVAGFEDGAWRFLVPRTGWRAWNADTEALLVWHGGAWIAFESGGGGGGFDPDNVSHLFINGADPVDPEARLAVRANAALFHALAEADSGSGDVRVQLSKETAAHTASIFFSTDYDGRAEFGLVESENFKLKVSADGESWIDALDIDPATGRVRLPAAIALTHPDQAVAKRDVRERLSANRTYYVRTDGSDANDGLANSAGGAFQTFNKAIATVLALDISIYAVVIQAGAGTYTGTFLLREPWVGSGTVTLRGDITTPANVTIAKTDGGEGIYVTGTGVRLNVEGFKLTNTAAQGLRSANGANVIISGKMEFGSCAGYHYIATAGGLIAMNGAAHVISGGAQSHYFASANGIIETFNTAWTLTGTPAFGVAFAQLQGAQINTVNNSVASGTATGKRYSVTLNGVCNVNGGGANLFPGNVAGTVATGGQYA